MNQNMNRTRLTAMTAVFALCAALPLFARGEAEEAPDEERETVTVASNVQIPLRIFYDGEDIRGYEYEVYTEALERAGYEVEVEDVDFSGIIPGLQAEQWDVAASNIFITEERAGEMDYSEPYLESFDAMIVREDDDSISDFSDLEGKVVGTEVGTTQAAFASQLEEEHGPFEETRGYDDIETQLQDLENGRIDALTLGHPTAVEYIDDGRPFQVLGLSEENFMIGAFFREGDSLRDEFTEALQEMKEDGTTAELYETYFGDPPDEGSAPVRVFSEPYEPSE